MTLAKVFRVDDHNVTQEKQDDEMRSEGIWIGIDLGTSTTTVAVWDLHKQRSKLLRFPSTLSPKIERNGKMGRCIPSAVLFLNPNEESIQSNQSQSNICVGFDAIKRIEEKLENETSRFLITSAKRIWGMTYSQIQDEIQRDSDFLKSLPFDCRLDDNGDSKEGLKIRISQNPNESDPHTVHALGNEWIEPLDIARFILTSVRLAAQDFIYKQRRNLHALGAPISDEKDQFQIRNCVLAIPAHYSRNQRRLVVGAATKAGFQRVETIIESTAAALSYGLFVSPKSATSSNQSSNAIIPKDTIAEREAKIIVVFDMGAGTTDVTIVEMNIDPQDDNAKFQVIATAGDKHLGGDDMDDALAQFILQKHGTFQDHCSNLENFDSKDYSALRRLCRKAKEDLCGNDSWKDMREPKSLVTVYWKGVSIEIRQDDFCRIIQPLVDRVRNVVDNAFISMDSKMSHVVDEVVVVGGASKTPSIRDLLRSRFPPPNPPELCCSIKGEAAVAQGAAIQSAILSNLVPKYELRNAMMLDALPHAIGVLIHPFDNDGTVETEEEYIPILPKNSPLPSKGSSSFRLAHIRQKGISVTLVEDVGDDYPLQRIGECNFLLHRLSENEIKAKCPNGLREVDVEIRANKDGSLTVSYFDENDPDHIKRRKFEPNTVVGESPKSTEEILLLVACIVIFLLYVGTKIIFNNVEVIA